MIEEQKFEMVEPAGLCAAVAAKKAEGCRLVQIGCTRTKDRLEMNYSFDKAYAFVNLRVVLPFENDGLPSVSPIYWSAFLYENEIHDLYGVAFKDMALDYKGNFYRTVQKAPFNTSPAAAPAAAKPEKKDA